MDKWRCLSTCHICFGSKGRKGQMVLLPFFLKNYTYSPMLLVFPKLPKIFLFFLKKGEGPFGFFSPCCWNPYDKWRDISTCPFSRIFFWWLSPSSPPFSPWRNLLFLHFCTFFLQKSSPWSPWKSHRRLKWVIGS